ncbi:LysM domain-containing protein [Metallumcola ferriviriculae]|uniref:LysM domain-containing protein n=1 Tax=Metallumcola ferriviriculae TaxID=3039180 RepID=A0AAU0UKM8_9FIRM|nr:LysM domain-containing protein [Desulfitibacteraceae bacterium MK1]
MSTPCPSNRFWEIRPGDTLFLIALQIGTTEEILQQLNPTVDPRNLHVGGTLCLPPTGCPSGVFWVVAQGDTLFTIAQAIGTTVERLLELNPNIIPTNLQIGQAICLPD